MNNDSTSFKALRSVAYQLVTLVTLLISFQYFTNSPLSPYITNIEKIYTPFVLLFIAVYVINKIIKTKRLDTIDIITISMSFGIPLYSAFMAKLFWGQPIIHGITTQKFWLIGLGCLLIYYFLVNGYITLIQLHRMMLGIAWVSLFLYLAAEVLFDAAKYRDSTFVYCNPAKGGCGFKFNTFFLAYAMLFYYIKAIREQKHIWLLATALFFAYFLFFFQKRGIIIITGLTFLLVLGFNTKPKQFIQYISVFMLSFILMLGSVFVISQTKFYNLVGQYGNFVDIIMGEETGEGSADSRLRELATMAGFSSQHNLSWIFGNGKWSDNWESNPALVERFYPSDLGLLGSLFVYGVVGFILVHIQFIFVLRWIQKNETTPYPTVYAHLKYFLLYFYLRSIFSGAIFFASGPAITLFFLMLLYHVKKSNPYVSPA